ncbi:hypothetical protein TWF970_010762 [Orbilia oligospora]|uniref:Uncharacterized protein n=1 Tax=Orbilia oligospora TaxID=2813651 RepID=A0A7C8R6T7_ORBOL|nr:hypothetical protein TWF970_010762 [Orbilia oligospora]
MSNQPNMPPPPQINSTFYLPQYRRSPLPPSRSLGVPPTYSPVVPTWSRLSQIKEVIEREHQHLSKIELQHQGCVADKAKLARENAQLITENNHLRAENASLRQWQSLQTNREGLHIAYREARSQVAKQKRMTEQMKGTTANHDNQDDLDRKDNVGTKRPRIGSARKGADTPLRNSEGNNVDTIECDHASEAPPCKTA